MMNVIDLLGSGAVHRWKGDIVGRENVAIRFRPTVTQRLVDHRQSVRVHFRALKVQPVSSVGNLPVEIRQCNGAVCGLNDVRCVRMNRVDQPCQCFATNTNSV